MQAHNLQKSHGKQSKRIGRGGKRGSFSGRGIKGQKARAGRRIRPQIREAIKKIHKRRGYGKSRARSVNPFRLRPEIVNLGDIEKKFKDGEKVTAKSLLERGLVKYSGSIKILGSRLSADTSAKAGKLTKKLEFDKSLAMSKSVAASLKK